MSLNEIPLVTIDGEPTSLAPYADKVKLIVNVASRCGLSPQ
jgi:glutathione peroxidase